VSRNAKENGRRHLGCIWSFLSKILCRLRPKEEICNHCQEQGVDRHLAIRVENTQDYAECHPSQHERHEGLTGDTKFLSKKARSFDLGVAAARPSAQRQPSMVPIDRWFRDEWSKIGIVVYSVGRSSGPSTFQIGTEFEHGATTVVF